MLLGDSSKPEISNKEEVVSKNAEVRQGTGQSTLRQ